MNYYEQVQKAIEYIEDNIEDEIDLLQIANIACMSLASLYRIFFSLTGYTLKEYIRLRRINLAANLICDSDMTIVEIALKYGFNTNESFSRAFKKVTGKNPSDYRKTNEFLYDFPKLNIISTYFENLNSEIRDKYPDIKVLKYMEPMKAACYRVFSASPEEEAITKIEYYAKLNQIKGYRIFGYDISDSSNSIYGYEACITLSDGQEINNEGVETKMLEGGLFAVTCVNVEEIRCAWQRFNEWLKISPYSYGDQQCLEEHIEGINDSFDYKIQLFMPIKDKTV